MGLVEPSGPCDPGYICLRRSYTSAPQDPVIGGLCPQGGYCPAGSFDKTVCPAGKFNNFTGGRSPDDCSPCPAGYFCSGADSTTPAGLCRAGFFCPGSCSSDSCECPLDVTCNQAVRGFYTAPGFATQRACPPGTFQPSFQSVDCEPCPAGRYCPVPAIDSVLDALECPAGFYCPSRSVEPLVCPPGSYSDTTQFSNVSACITCDAAKVRALMTSYLWFFVSPLLPPSKEYVHIPSSGGILCLFLCVSRCGVVCLCHVVVLCSCRYCCC